MRTLLVDGDNLFKIGFHGVREFYVDGEHIGGVFHFVNTLRKQVDEYDYDKVVVFWDGIGNSSVRREIYPKYKLNRRQTMNEYQHESYRYQKERVKQYLEECFIRQIRVDNNEADDLIAYYCSIGNDEQKVILSADQDLIQLVSPITSIYSPIKKFFIRNGDKINMLGQQIPHENVRTIKVIMGDKSDNIDGISLMGDKTFLKFFPEVVDRVVNVSDILERGQQLLEEHKSNKALMNLIKGITKDGELGLEFFERNKKIVDLLNPLISNEGKEMVELYYRETLDPEGRGSKNLIRMMTEDGFFKYLPKDDEAFVNFVKPFTKLTRKEKRKFNQENN